MTRSLQSRRVLLVLDNCEHLIGGCATTVEHLLKECPTLTVLTTGREPLNLAVENVHPLSPLEPAEAAALFVERATAADSDFAERPREPEVLTQNARACAFYERHGFRVMVSGINAINGQPNIEYRWQPGAGSA